MFYGADYYPEQETREEAVADAARMRRQGFNTVRMGEFVWTLLEPREGGFDFEWLLDRINILGEQGIYTLLCTPTACPPIWLVEKHPEVLYVDNRGVTRPFGGRRHYCYTSEAYRRYCARIAGKLAAATEGNPYVRGIHIDNEMAQEATGRCHCPVCRQKFQVWLEEKYSTIEEWNRRAGTIFWNQTYERFDQIPLPLKTVEAEGADLLYPFLDNPTLRLDFERFASDSMTEFIRVQTDAVRTHTKRPVTTNTTGVWTSGLNYYDAFRDLDIAAVDEYPSLRTESLCGSSFTYAFIRGLKQQEHFWVVETSSGGGQGSWARQGVPQPYPGAVRQMPLHALTCGASMFLYFQYKAFRYGAEQLEAAVLDIDGRERRRNVEMREASGLMEQWERALAGTAFRSDIAICFDYDSHWAIKIKPFHKEFDYLGNLLSLYGMVKRTMREADVVPIDETLLRYRVVILPATVVLGEAQRELLKRFTRQGGTLIATYLTGIKNADNNADRAAVPAGLTDLFGLCVDEADPVYENTAAGVRVRLNGREWYSQNRYWCESLKLDGAQELAAFTDSFRAGEATAAVHAYGAGKAYYLGTHLDEPAMISLLDEIARDSGCEAAPFVCPYGVEVTTRYRAEAPVYAVFNALEGPAPVGVPSGCADALTGKPLPEEWVLAAKEARLIIRREEENNAG